MTAMIRRILSARRARIAAALAIAIVAAVGSAAAGSAAKTADYKAALDRMLAQHKRIAAAEAELRATEANIRRAKGGWYPDLKVTSNMGVQALRQDPATHANRRTPREIGVSANQLLWDFGKTNAEIDRTTLVRDQSAAALATTRQDLLLEGLVAYVNLHRVARSAQFARQSVDNIRRQTGMEESRVELGGGLPTDVLQAKSQLAGAQARLVRAEGALKVAMNRYRAVFNEPPPEPSALTAVPVPRDRLPASQDEAIAVALERNLQLRSTRLSAEIARAEVRRVTGGELYPRIAAVAESKLQRDVNGMAGDRQDNLAKVEITYPFNTGLAPFHALEAARNTVTAAENRLADARDLVEEQVRNAWQSLSTARDNADYLENQARIAAQFLRLAREERLQGQRSLIDVLAGETALINAQSDAVSAEADVAIAAFTLLKAMGDLDPAVLK